MKKMGCFLWLFVACIASGEMAEDAGAGLGFRGMEIYRFENGAALPQVYDLNGDGLDDIVFANNNASRLEVLVRARPEPPPDAGRAPELDTVFTNHGVVVDQQVIACLVTTLDASGAPSILTLGRELGLYEYRFADGALQPARRIFLKAPERLMDLRAADLDGNGHTDLIVCRKDSLEILWNDGDARFMRRVEMPITPPDALKVEVADFTGDGRSDLLVFMAGDATLPRLRPGAAGGRFGAEAILPIAPARCSTALPVSSGAVRLASIIQSGRGLRLYGVERAPAAAFLTQDEVLPMRIPLRGVSPRIPPAWVVADFDGDGFDDFCVAAPELGQIHVYAGSDAGLEAEPARHDSLAGINAMSLTDAGDLLVFSTVEKTAALHARSRLGEFPRLLPAPQPEPLIAAAHPGRPAVIWVCRDPITRSATLTEQPLALSERTPEDAAAGDAPPFAFPLVLPNDPDAIRVCRMDGQNTGIMLFIPYQPPVFHVLNTAAELVNVPSASFNAAAIALRPAMADARGDNLLLGLGGVAREFSWAENTWQARRQFSPAGANASLTAAAYFQTTPDARGVALFDQNANGLLWFDPESEAPRYVHIGFPMAAPVGMHPLRAAGGRHDAGLALITAQEVFVFHDAPAFKMDQTAEYASPAEEPSLADARGVNLGQPPRPLIALTDTRNRTLEIVEFADRKLIRRMAFEIFQDPGFASARARGGMEPREIASGDLNGDGIGDLVLLVHDKLIIYLGE